MIGKITTGKSFSQLMNYLYKEGQGAKTIFKTTVFDTPEKIVKDFNRVARLRPTTTKPCKHIICSFAPKDGEVPWFTKADVAEEIVRELGYVNNQFLVVEHARNGEHHSHKHDHDHIHIVVNMIGYSGRRTNDFRDKSRLERILRSLEKKYKLTQIESSRRKDHTRVARRPRTKAYRHFEQEYKAWQKELKSDRTAPPPEEPEVQHLQSVILAAVEDKPTMTVYLARLQQQGYRVEFFKTPKGRKRLRYHLKRPENKGRFVTNLAGGSLHQLKKAGVSYSSKRDNPAIKSVRQNKTIALPEHLKLDEAKIWKYKFQWLDTEQRQAILTARAIAQKISTVKEPQR